MQNAVIIMIQLPLLAKYNYAFCTFLALVLLEKLLYTILEHIGDKLLGKNPACITTK